MFPEQKALVKATWFKVAPMADAAACLFYDRLFEIDPTTRPLFKTTDLAEQRRKLVQALTMVVQGLDHLEALVPTIADLGRLRSHGRPLRGGRCGFALDPRARAWIGVDAGGEGCLVLRLCPAGRCHAGNHAREVRDRLFVDDRRLRLARGGS